MTKAPGPGRILCPVCHHSVRVTEHGTIAPHTAHGTMVSPAPHCGGSGRRPPAEGTP